MNIYGLTRPFDFRRAIPFVCAVSLLTFILLLWLVLAALGMSNSGSQRHYFFIYVSVLAAAAAVASVVPAIAWPLIVIGALELSVGGTTNLLGRWDMGRTVFPNNVPFLRPPFDFHPLLQGRPAAGFSGDVEGAIVTHSRYGWRTTPAAPPLSSDAVLVAALGGSTTYDLGLEDGATWTNQLQLLLGRTFAVQNFGVPGYSTVEALIQTAFYLDVAGREPDCAIYYLGWNDIRNSHLPDLDPAYANFHLLAQLGNLQTRRRLNDTVAISPVARILFPLVQTQFDSVPLPRYPDQRPRSDIDRRLEGIFRKNVRSIAALNAAHGTRPLFIGQILNRARLTGNTPYGWIPLLNDQDVWTTQAHFNAVLLEEAAALKVPALALAIEDFEDADFLDHGHFSKQGARKFAGQIAETVSRVCRPSQQPAQD